MKKIIYIISIICGILVISYPGFMNGKINGSPGGKTGSPVDGSNCTQCHAGVINSGQGDLNITSNIPSSGYIPGTIYTINIDMNHPNFVKYGFELTAEGGTGVNPKIGGFSITNPIETKLINSNNAVTHTSNGINGSQGTSGFNKNWSVDWQAPSSGQGTINIYAAGVTANNDGDNSGDQVYTTSYSINEDLSTSTDQVLKKDVNINLQNYKINIYGDDIIKEIQIFNINGKHVIDYTNIQLPYSINTSTLPSGVYIIKLIDINNNENIKKIITR